MATSSNLDRVSMVMLRYMRGPIFALIVVYAIGITGMALIPGRAPDGSVEYMNLFHAFYFFTFTATTTGFGEIPYAFSDAQRLWAILCIYMGVIAWLYAIGSIFRLVQNPHFLLALNEHTFARSVRRLKDPFFIICGFGDTGSLLARGLSDHWLHGVVVDTDPERIKALHLRDYHFDMQGLCADPTVPKHLINAGVRMPNCKAMVILTADEEVNERIAVMTRLLNPDLRILCRSSSRRHIDHLNSLGNVTIINPFEIFAQLMSMAITAPHLHNLNSCLVRAPGAKLEQPIQVPTGDWIICGYGRMGQWLYRHFIKCGIKPVIIDPNADDVEGAVKVIKAQANRETLKEAGLDHAAGVVAGTNSDFVNLDILMCVESIKPDAFTIARQNNHENQIAFDAVNVDLILQSSLTTARRVLKHLISPQVQTFIEYLRVQGEDTCEQAAQRLHAMIGDNPPHLWQICLNERDASAVVEHLQKGSSLKIAELQRNPHNPAGNIPAMPLSVLREGSYHMLPQDDLRLCEGDLILFCGTEHGETMLYATINNIYTLNYLITGEDQPRGYLFRWIESLRSKPVSVKTG
jgi:Trk K+ transport system NAD-binding subunit